MLKIVYGSKRRFFFFFLFRRRVNIINADCQRIANVLKRNTHRVCIKYYGSSVCHECVPRRFIFYKRHFAHNAARVNKRWKKIPSLSYDIRILGTSRKIGILIMAVFFSSEPIKAIEDHRENYCQNDTYTLKYTLGLPKSENT